MTVLTTKPKELRQGQTLFLFLAWLWDTKKINDGFSFHAKGLKGKSLVKLTDPFNIEDKDFDIYYDEFLKTIK